LKDIIDNSSYLGYEGAVCLEIWNKYLNDKEEYYNYHKRKQRKAANLYKDEVMNSVFKDSIEKRQTKRREETQVRYTRWQKRVNELAELNPKLSHSSICKRIATETGDKEDTIRKATSKPS
jgi:hypothetical protein